MNNTKVFKAFSVFKSWLQHQAEGSKCKIGEQVTCWGNFQKQFLEVEIFELGLEGEKIFGRQGWMGWDGEVTLDCETGKEMDSLEHRDVLEIRFKKQPLTLFFWPLWTPHFITVGGREESYYLFGTYHMPGDKQASPHLICPVVIWGGYDYPCFFRQGTWEKTCPWPQNLAGINRLAFDCQPRALFPDSWETSKGFSENYRRVLTIIFQVECCSRASFLALHHPDSRSRMFFLSSSWASLCWGPLHACLHLFTALPSLASMPGPDLCCSRLAAYDLPKGLVLGSKTVLGL